MEADRYQGVATQWYSPLSLGTTEHKGSQTAAVPAGGAPAPAANQPTHLS